MSSSPEDRLPDDNAPVLLLCDYAEVINGKLYIHGGGINQIAANQPLLLGLAMFWNMPWDQANVRQTIQMRCMTEDGRSFRDAENKKLEITGFMEIGRPPGAKHGAPFPAPLALRLPPMQFPAGGYSWELRINDALRATARFQALGGPA